MQCLFALPQFQKRYYQPQELAPLVDEPASDLETQYVSRITLILPQSNLVRLRKLADGLLSGQYSYPDKDIQSETEQYQRGLAPSMFKHLVGRGHPEFSTMKQQDSFEFLQHVFKLISRSKNEYDPTTAFQFVMEQRLQCLSCKKVRYSTVEQDNLSIPVPMKKVAGSRLSRLGLMRQIL